MNKKDLLIFALVIIIFLLILLLFITNIKKIESLDQMENNREYFTERRYFLSQ